MLLTYMLSLEADLLARGSPCEQAREDRTRLPNVPMTPRHLRRLTVPGRFCS
jgi:hypothetical protein